MRRHLTTALALAALTTPPAAQANHQQPDRVHWHAANRTIAAETIRTAEHFKALDPRPGTYTTLTPGACWRKSRAEVRCSTTVSFRFADGSYRTCRPGLSRVFSRGGVTMVELARWVCRDAPYWAWWVAAPVGVRGLGRRVVSGAA